MCKTKLTMSVFETHEKLNHLINWFSKCSRKRQWSDFCSGRGRLRCNRLHGCGFRVWLSVSQVKVKINELSEVWSVMSHRWQLCLHGTYSRQREPNALPVPPSARTTSVSTSAENAAVFWDDRTWLHWHLLSYCTAKIADLWHYFLVQKTALQRIATASL